MLFNNKQNTGNQKAGNQKTGWIFPAVAGAGLIAVAGYSCARISAERARQKRVDASAPEALEHDLSVSDDHIRITKIDTDEGLNLDNYQECVMSENEAKEWESLFSTLGGETLKGTATAAAFSGLLKCDVPLKDLCRIKDNPELMRGFVINDGKITRQASFSEAGLGNVAPLLVYQCMAAVTSQYYQHIITERLNAIDGKLDNIMRFLSADDRAKLKVAYDRFVELSKKNTYDIADKQIVSESSGCVDIVREKYRDLLRNLKPLYVSYKRSDKKEAEGKVQALRDSHYFDYLEMAMQAEVLSMIAAVISIKVAKWLGNDEDARIFAGRINLDYWNTYVNQFRKVKHDVITYLELAANSSWLQEGSIMKLMDKQLQEFNYVEASMLKLQAQFECGTVQYIKRMPDGTLKKYIAVSE